MRHAGQDLLITARAPVRLRGRGTRNVADHPLPVRPGLGLRRPQGRRLARAAGDAAPAPRALAPAAPAAGDPAPAALAPRVPAPGRVLPACTAAPPARITGGAAAGRYSDHG